MNVLPTATPGPADRRRRPGRSRRLLRRAGIAVVLVLALIGAWSTWGWFTAPPGSGHFRSAEGREIYAAAYEASFEALPAPTATHDLPTSHGIVRVYEWSSPATAEEEPVVLVPGRASGVPMWAENLPALAEEHPVFAFDPLGDAGMSVQSVRFDGFDDQAAYIDDVIEQVAPDGAHVVGHSFGGRLAASFALAHPGDVHSLTLLEPAMTFASPPLGMLLWTGVAFVPGLPESVKTRALTEIGGEPYDPEDPMARMIEAGSEHYVIAQPQPSMLSEEQTAALDVPTYVAIGERDSLAGGQRAVDGAAALPDATVEVWPGTTHSLPMQAGPDLDRTVLAHIDAHPGTG
jgi:pimeloyl-ACP methyl ester carboxylesterase